MTARSVGASRAAVTKVIVRARWGSGIRPAEEQSVCLSRSRSALRAQRAAPNNAVSFPTNAVADSQAEAPLGGAYLDIRQQPNHPRLVVVECLGMHPETHV